MVVEVLPKFWSRHLQPVRILTNPGLRNNHVAWRLSQFAMKQITSFDHRVDVIAFDRDFLAKLVSQQTVV